ncbi:MAG: glycoside hydrolase family 3 protein [Clostridiales bacterium]|nr:glycoside hydrolase family 3 protein [Clostridiales bacterium]
MLAGTAACSTDREKEETQKKETEAVTESAETETPATTTETTEEEPPEPQTAEYKYMQYAKMTPEEIVAGLTLEQKAAQMVQPAVYCVTEEDMRENDYGSILSTPGSLNAHDWRDLVDGFQQAAIESEAGIPYVYGQDDVHGVNYCLDAVYFPHNIGMGAADNEELMYKVGLITADEARLCHMLWNFSPVVAQSADPRWGRTYESYGSDLDLIKRLSTAYTRGLIDGGLIACSKHFLADGNVVYGTGEQGTAGDLLIDRGDAQLTDEEISALLEVYQAQIDAGVQTIMISHSSLNGVKMHENGKYIMMLKNEMGFEGFIVSDWNSVQNTSGATYEEQIINSVNAGIDMFMEIDRYEEARQIIVDAVKDGRISEDRVNDAVTRIIKVKLDAGIFDDPLCGNMETVQQETGSMEYREIAEKLVEESLVLIKNDDNVLPLSEGTKVYITGPAADNCQAQCGGWTISWNASPMKNISGVTTILEAFERYADDYGIEVITDSSRASEADVVLLCVGEQSYAEWNGDTEDLELVGELGLNGNAEAIEEARSLGKPTVTLIIAGRNVILDPDDYAGWDSVVMCYLPGSEGKGISDVLCGCSDFTGRLPSPWYGSVEQIGTDDCFLDVGYGLSYGDGFTARTEPKAVSDYDYAAVDDGSLFDRIAEGTDYTPGLFKDNVYTNDHGGIVLGIPGDFIKIDSDLIESSQEEHIENELDGEMARIYGAMITDAVFVKNAEDEYVSIEVDYINIDLYSPDAAEYPIETFSDLMYELIVSDTESAGAEMTYGGRQSVTLCGEEYIRDAFTIDYNGMEFHECRYLRRVDDDLLCQIYVSIMDSDLTCEDVESWFIAD